MLRISRNDIVKFARPPIFMLHAFHAGRFRASLGADDDAHDGRAKMMYTPQHVANYFLDRANAESRNIDPLKLIKLVYIAYGWVLALTGERLFDEPIQAWKHGPVIPSIYHEFKHYRSEPICEPSGIFDMETGSYDIPKVPKSDPTTNLILEKVWAAYRRYTGWALRNKTHEPNTPWTMTYDGSKDKIIPDELISSHFHKKIREIVDAARAA